MSDEPLPFAERIAEKIEPSNIVIDLELFAEMPSTGNAPLRTRINQMVALRDGSDRLYLTDLNGKIYEISSGKAKLYLDFLEKIPDFTYKNGLGEGLASLEFHPNFAENGLFYTSSYAKLDETILTEEIPDLLRRRFRTAVITEWVDTNPHDDTFTGTHRDIFRVIIPTPVHGIQQIAFNPYATQEDPDFGLLYICLGESGSLQTQRSNYLRRLDSPLGCILRIDPSGTGGNFGDYGIPAGNPWANDDDESTLGEIWCYGTRNPHRLSWDPEGTGRMFFGDIGEMRAEEINIAEAGRDYGWPIREGMFRFDPHGLRFQVFALDDEAIANDTELTYPVAQYDHREGYAISGGYVYRGSKLPHLYGKYIFGDIVNGRIFFADEKELQFGSLAPISEFFVRVDGESSSMARLSGGGRVDLRFGCDADGELFLFEKGFGRIYKVVSSSSTDDSGALAKSGLDLQLNEHAIKADPERGVPARSMIDDFEDGDILGEDLGGGKGKWQRFVSDEPGSVKIEVVSVEDAPGNGDKVLRIAGTGWEEEGSRVILPLTLLSEDASALHCDASKFDGVRFWVKYTHRDFLRPIASTVYTVSSDRGGLCDGVNYECENFYTARVTLKDGWNLLTLPFTQFTQSSYPNDGPLDPSILKEIGVRLRPGANYEFLIDDFEFYKEEAVE
ncbi:PQQ-dependent sugar dehydrogenase [Puniceicoccaceae bacterium K14]|nr:PQQ-dependent sugar dehydrogenase [Puniceicoccaceae bacterium K14]